jgi:hypothetical protein
VVAAAAEPAVVAQAAASAAVAADANARTLKFKALPNFSAPAKP